MEEELAAAWSAGVSQIYPALARLRRNGWVLLRTLGPRRGPPRLLYRVTAAGRRELARWLMAVAPVPPQRRHDPLLVRLAFLDVLSAADRRRVLSGIDTAVASEVERWRSAPPPEGARGLARRAAIEEREALRRLLAREIEPAIPPTGSSRKRVPVRRKGVSARRRG